MQRRNEKLHEGTTSPLFLYLKMFRKLVEDLLAKALEERKDLFLISFNISETNEIKVEIDGDQGVLVEDCVFVSRAIEHNIDRDEYDFSLEVTSAGALSPLVNIRQYAKNKGRHLKVTHQNDEVFKGVLADVIDNAIVLEWKAREPKPIGKGKITVNKSINIEFELIKEAVVEIKF